MKLFNLLHMICLQGQSAVQQQASLISLNNDKKNQVIVKAETTAW